MVFDGETSIAMFSPEKVHYRKMMFVITTFQPMTLNRLSCNVDPLVSKFC